ncbi:uncharacterized protein CTHT_0015600 [Thermochaetoides thermophila DSM 1495]|uniref:BZIP domain-containing protein n=1 Tax=Chaetomium thermophilum (strain DSM 1495 / CBS 144.50 / IMI 039719) TaxID=759272 RepID=G0S214_CHATD|nr:hypothetical protein CTHT_0015600 [Thermochaetoides thermophila DSM 1495]EGS23074.1 hypothetical protein CTHT_0015600 [Thermochaetoides thermophila DSM 1495]
MSSLTPTSQAGPDASLTDQMLDLLDLSAYDSQQFDSASSSPLEGLKTTSVPEPTIPETTAAPGTFLSSPQSFPAPSHQYDQYKQQTGIVPGALATTFAVNENNPNIPGYMDFSVDLLSTTSSESFTFNSPLLGSNPQGFSDWRSGTARSPLNRTLSSPHLVEAREQLLASSRPNAPMGRVYPGMHQQQAALAKLREQQRQQEQLRKLRAASSDSSDNTDPVIQEQINKILSEMRNNPLPSPEPVGPPILQAPRQKKPEAEMDEDEKLLNSEQGKALSSKERRQLRNKVSARAFRSRRKEYIAQLESEVSKKHAENAMLRHQNKALIMENQRLGDFVRHLLSKPAFASVLQELIANPDLLPKANPPPPTPRPQQQQAPQLPKDVNPYAAQQLQALQQQQQGLVPIPEDLSLDFAADTAGLSSLTALPAMNYQPQVFAAVFDTPEPVIDTSVLSGKSGSLFLFSSDDEDFSSSNSSDDKLDIPAIQACPIVPSSPEPSETTVTGSDTKSAPEPAAPVVTDEEFENDPAFELWQDSPSPLSTSSPVAPASPIAPAAELDMTGLSQVDIFGGIEPEKILARFELVDAAASGDESTSTVEEKAEDEIAAALAMARVRRLISNLEGVVARLELLTVELQSE